MPVAMSETSVGLALDEKASSIHQVPTRFRERGEQQKLEGRRDITKRREEVTRLTGGEEALSGDEVL